MAHGCPVRSTEREEGHGLHIDGTRRQERPRKNEPGHTREALNTNGLRKIVCVRHRRSETSASATQPRDCANQFALCPWGYPAGMASFQPAAPCSFPVTPDRRYFVVRGRLWRRTNPELPEQDRTRLVADLMRSRQQVKEALRNKDAESENTARRAVDAAKRGLGERGTPWWTDGAPDYNRCMVSNTPYAGWYAALGLP